MKRRNRFVVESSPEPESERDVGVDKREASHEDILRRCYQSRGQLVVGTYQQRSSYIMHLAAGFRGLGRPVLILTSHAVNISISNSYPSEIAYYADNFDGDLTDSTGIVLQNIDDFVHRGRDFVNTVTGRIHDSIDLDLFMPKDTVVLIDEAESVATDIIAYPQHNHGRIVPVEAPLIIMLLCAERASNVYLFTSSPVVRGREDLKSLLFLVKGITPPGTNDYKAFNNLSIAATKEELISNWTCLVSMIPKMSDDPTLVTFPSKIFERIEAVMTAAELKKFEQREKTKGWNHWGDDDEGIITLSRTKSKLERMIDLVRVELTTAKKPIIIIYTSSISYAEEVLVKALKKQFKKMFIDTIGADVLPFAVHSALENVRKANASILIYHDSEPLMSMLLADTAPEHNDPISDAWTLLTSFSTCVILLDPVLTPLTQARLSGSGSKKLYRIMAVKKTGEWTRMNRWVPDPLSVSIVEMTVPSAAKQYGYDSFYDARIEQRQALMSMGYQWLSVVAQSPCTTSGQMIARESDALERKMLASSSIVDYSMTESKAIQLELERRNGWRRSIQPLTKDFVENLFAKPPQYGTRGISVYLGLRSQYFELISKPRGDTLTVPNISGSTVLSRMMPRAISLPSTPQPNANQYYNLNREVTRRLKSYDQTWTIINGQYHTSPEYGSEPIFVEIEKIAAKFNGNKRRRSDLSSSDDDDDDDQSE